MNLDGVTLDDKITKEVLEDNFISVTKFKDNDLNIGLRNSLKLLDLLKFGYFDKYEKDFIGEEKQLLIDTVGSKDISFDDILLTKFKLNRNEYSINDYLNNAIGEYVESRPATDKEKEKAARKKLFNYFLPILEDDPYHELNKDVYNTIMGYYSVHLIMLLWWISIQTKESKKLSSSNLTNANKLFKGGTHGRNTSI